MSIPHPGAPGSALSPARPPASRRAALGAIAALPLLLARPARAQPATGWPRTIADVNGRQLRLARPAQRVVLGFYFEDFTAIAGAAAWDRVVGISRTLWADWRPNNYALYTRAVPRIAEAVDIGATDNGSFSAEAVIALRPDLVILSHDTFRRVSEAVAQFEALGIPVLVADYNAQTLERHVASTRAIGAAMGTEERAEALVAEYTAATTDLQNRVAAARAAGGGAARVYFELGQGGAGVIGNSYQGTMWGRITESLAGQNIAQGRIPGPWGPLNPELVLAADPQFIFIASSSWAAQPQAVRSGYGIAPEETRARLRDYPARPGWSGLSAIRAGELHAIEHGIARTLFDYVGAQYIARRLYPQACADLDPEAALRRYHQRWLPVAFSGTWMLRAAP
jgi:ABC-type Fe3+-hydroxamate transport system substrate-binding protein